jgi:hypothetical protein
MSNWSNFPTTHLLANLAILKDVFQRDIELAHVVLAKSIVIPADTFQQWDAQHGHFK